MDEETRFGMYDMIEKVLTKRMIKEFLADWNKIWRTKPVESAYAYYSITEEEYKSIKKKWESELKNE